MREDATECPDIKTRPDCTSAARLIVPYEVAYFHTPPFADPT